VLKKERTLLLHKKLLILKTLLAVA